MLANEDQTIPNYFLNKIIDQRYGYANNRHYYYFDIDINDDTKWNMTYIVSLPIFEDIDDVKNNIIIDKINVDIIELDKFLVSTREDKSIITEEIGDIDQLKSEKIMIHFGPMNDSAEDYYNIEKRDCTLKGLGLEDVRIETQDNAQKSLVTINDAIVKKDQARAYYGAMQIRLENTVSNLTIQAENLQASESRISDVDVATEMTNFVRNQILTQSAVAMLSQANSMPQMAMQLIGG
ncbi:MAG: flagellin [Desulfovibrio sp.]|nr:flagellin [Desulfovibrio sp.]